MKTQSKARMQNEIQEKKEWIKPKLEELSVASGSLLFTYEGSYSHTLS